MLRQHETDLRSPAELEEAAILRELADQDALSALVGDQGAVIPAHAWDYDFTAAELIESMRITRLIRSEQHHLGQ